MKRILTLAALFLSVPIFATTYYVGPSVRGDGSCLTDHTHDCLPASVWAKFPTAGDTIEFAGVDFKTDGLYQGSNNMIQPPHPATPTIAAVAGGGTMTAGIKTFVYTQTCGGVEQGVSKSSQATFATNGRVTISGVATGNCVGGGTRTKATIYASKDETLGTSIGNGDLYKVGSGCQTPFNDAVTTSATCDPGPDSGWTALPTLPFAGAAGNVLTIKATNRYGVLIDGQFNNAPLYLQRNNSYITVDGIRFTRGTPTPGTCVLCNNPGARNNTYQFLVAWDAPLQWNSYVAGTLDNNNWGVDQNIVFDHIGLFGSGRKLFVPYGGNGPVTLTNSILVYGGSENAGPKIDASLFYNSFRSQIRDTVGFWNAEAIPSSYNLWDNHCQVNTSQVKCPNPAVCSQTPLCGSFFAAYDMDNKYGMFAADRNDFSNQVNASVYGLIAVKRSSDHGTNLSGIYYVNMGGITVKDSVSSDVTGTESLGPVYLGSCGACSAPKNLVATNVTEISSVTGTASADWTKTNAVIHLANSSTFTYDGSSGTSKTNICFQHDSSGNVTATKRFNNADDIALNNAVYASMSYAGYTPIDATAEVATALGAIPAACDASAGGNTPTPSLTPTNTFTPSNTPSPTPTFTPTPTVTGVLTATPTPSGCWYWHPATDQGPGYYANEACGLTWSHLHPTPTPIP